MEQPSFLDRLIKASDIIMGRAWTIGPSVVELADIYHGHDTEQFAPQEYGEYIATSAHVYVCARLRAQLLSSLPLRLYQGVDSKRKEVESGPLYDLLHKVNPYWTFSRLLEMTELSLLLWGSAFWFLERDGKGRPKEIWWARSDRVSVVPHPKKYVGGFIYRPLNSEQEIRYAPEEVIWLRYPNPIDEFSGLSPLAAARLSADMTSAAMKSNRNIFANGTNMGGIITPVSHTSGKEEMFSQDQANQLNTMLGQKMKGVSNSHRIAVLRFDAKFQPLTMSPKDAEFLGLMKWGLEDIARVYGVPLDLIGGQRTFENVDAAKRTIWTQTVIPEARFIQNELIEQLLPMFPGMGDLLEFDTSDIDELKADENAEWERWDKQIKAGAVIINEWREEKGLKPVPWGDAWWAPANLMPVKEEEDVEFPPSVTAKVLEEEPLAIAPGDDPESEEMDAEIEIAAERIMAGHQIEYGSPEHNRIWNARMRAMAPHESRLIKTLSSLMHRQRQSYVAKIRRGELPPLDDDDTPEGRTLMASIDGIAGRAVNPNFFDKSRWNKQYRIEVKPILSTTASDAAQQALDDLGLNLAFDVTDPNFVKFIEGRSQRFAERVNETTWEWVKKAIAQDIKQGNNMDRIADHVNVLMGDRIRSSAQTIARTETIGALNGGTLISFEQSGQVETKQWLSALDERTRESHVRAHGQTVPLQADFP